MGYFKAKAEDKRPIGALLTIFAVVILFWAVFKLNGSALTTWADRYTERDIKGTTQAVFNGLKLAKEVEYKKDTVELYDASFRIQKVDGEVQKTVDYPVYFRNVAKDKLPEEGSKVSLWATNLSQSINPGWVIILTPLVVAFFTFLRGRKKEPSTPTKIAFGLLISALSVLVMVAAVNMGANGSEKVSVWWLVANYGVITIGELFLTGKFNATRTVALAGSEVKEAQYYNVISGAAISDLVAGKIEGDNVRVISGDVLTGTKVKMDGNLGFYSNTVTVIPEGNVYRMFGWMPFASPSIHSASRTGLSWLMPGKKYAPNTNLNGEERALVVTGEMEAVMPLDIYPMQLLKACLAGNIDKMESLGIYEVAPEDFALIDYTNTSKLEAQEIIREALDLMIKEVG